MNAKLKKTMNIAAAAIFILGLAINVQMSLDDPFGNVSAVALAQQTGTDTSGPNQGKYLKEVRTGKQLVCTKVNGSLALAAGIEIGMLDKDVHASAEVKAQADWALMDCYKVICYENAGQEYCTSQDWTVCSSGGCAGDAGGTITGTNS